MKTKTCIMKTKTCILEDFKSFSDEGAHYITGYANNKGVEDSYGDIATSINGRPVYDLTKRFIYNPVALVDHGRSVGNIFGAFILGPGATYEDEKGLHFKLRLMDNPQTEIARHAVEAYKSGDARAFSIGGEWFYEDPTNKKNLTSAIIYEISGVAIGADPLAVVTRKALSDTEKETEGQTTQRVLEILVAEYRKSMSPQVLLAIADIQKRKGAL
jgi:hypothetical protein